MAAKRSKRSIYRRRIAAARVPFAIGDHRRFYRRHALLLLCSRERLVKSRSVEYKTTAVVYLLGLKYFHFSFVTNHGQLGAGPPVLCFLLREEKTNSFNSVASYQFLMPQITQPRSIVGLFWHLNNKVEIIEYLNKH